MTASAVVLRDYQARGHAELERRFGAGHRAVVVVSPTGSGKGTLAAHMLTEAAARGRHALFLVHRGLIAVDVYERVRAAGCRSVGLLVAGDPRERRAALVQVGTIDTARRRDHVPADLVIVDEAHRVMGASYQRLLATYPNARIVGLTATPTRLDRKGLRDTFEAMIVLAQPSELIAGGYVLKPRLVSPEEWLLPDLRGVGHRAGEFSERDLGPKVMESRIIGAIPEYWAQHARGLPTIAFAVNKEHSRAIVALFEGAGVRAEHIDADTTEDARRAALRRLAAQQTMVLSNCNLLVEGVDVPEVKGIIQGSPTESITRNLQQIGRALRPCGDAEAVVLDHAGNYLRHGFPWEDCDWELTDTPEKKAPQVKRCPCGTVVSRFAAVCAACGYGFDDADAGGEEPAPRQRVVLEIEGPMAEHDEGGVVRGAAPARAPAPRAVASERARREAYDHLRRTAFAQGLGERWAAERYRATFGEDPSALEARTRVAERAATRRRAAHPQEEPAADGAKVIDEIDF